MALFCNTTLPGCEPSNCTCDTDCAQNPEALNAISDQLIAVTLPCIIILACSAVWTLVEVWLRRKQGFTQANAILRLNLLATLWKISSNSYMLSILGTCTGGSAALSLIALRGPQLLWISCVLVLVGVWRDLSKSAKKLTRLTESVTRETLKRRLTVLCFMLMVSIVPTTILAALDIQRPLMEVFSFTVVGVYVLVLCACGFVYGWRTQRLLVAMREFGREAQTGKQTRRSKKGRGAVLHVRFTVFLLTLTGTAIIISLVVNYLLRGSEDVFLSDHLGFYLQVMRVSLLFLATLCVI